MLLNDAHPNVAAEPAMYCPRVRSMPFGPGPKRTMFVKPGVVSLALHTVAVPTLEHAHVEMRTKDEANDQTNSYRLSAKPV